MSSGQRLVLLIFLAFLPVALMSQSLPGAGLYLEDDRPQFRWPCSLELTHKRAILLESAFAVKFDLCIEDPERFGFVLHGNLDHSTKFSLAYAKYYSPDTSYLVLAVNGDPVSVSLPIPKLSLHTGAWHTVALYFDPSEQCISASLDGIGVPARQRSLPRKFSVQLTFGSLTRSGEVPAMGIREVAVLAKNEAKDTLRAIHHWALGELDGNEAEDDIGGLTGLVQHGAWLAESHIMWRQLTTIPAGDGIAPYSSFDPTTGTILFAGINDLLEYSTRSGALRTTHYRSPRSMVAGQTDFDGDRRRLYGHHPGGGEISVYDPTDKTWSRIDTTVGMKGDYNHHPSFVDPASGDIYLIGGYGWYTVKNHLCRYSFQTKKWEVIPKTGDSLEPRFGIALCRSGLPGQYYLCGGVGNASGKQDAGWLYYFDLWTLDLQNRRIRNLWRAGHTTVADRIIALVNAGANGQDDMYALFGPTAREDGALQLYKISAGMPGRRSVGEGLDVVMGWWPMLYFDSSYQRFLLVVPPRDQGDSAGVRIFSLAYPPMNRAELFRAGRDSSGTLFVVLVAGVIVSGLGLGFRYASKRSQPRPRKVPGRGEQRPEPTRPSIRIFGGFKVIDSSGTDISDQFSQRIRQLFLLLLIRTRYDEGPGGDGIGANELAELLWPGIDPQSAKDSRNVAIAALRKLLRRIGGVSIDLKNKNYFVHIGDEVDCDYKRFREAVHVMASTNGTRGEAGWNEILNICRTGVLMPGLSLSWLDAVRADVFSEFEKLASAKLSAVRDGAGELDLTTAEALLEWDPINEQALRTKLRVLWKSGRHGAARVAYEQFTANYASAYGRPCDLTMKDILSDQTPLQQVT